jgi:ElaB/YqjD/DUF883 family membrane-anchored ribosome-binding protein
MKDDSHRTAEEIEDHIALTRGRIDATLKGIEERLTTEQLVRQGVDYLRHSGAAEFAANLGGSVKHHPLPVSLVAVGLAWLMVGDRSDRWMAGHPAVHEDSTEHAGFGEKVEQLKSKGASVRHRISDATNAARDQASRISDGTREQWDKARDGYETVMREQPLALGAIGFGIGALCAALLPRTPREDALMGEASDRVTERAQAVASEGLDDVKRVGAAAAQAAGEVARSVRSAAAPEHPRTDQMQGSPPGTTYGRHERIERSSRPTMGAQATQEPRVQGGAEAAHASGIAARTRSDR